MASHSSINNRSLLANQFFNEYIDDEYMDGSYKDEDDNHLVAFINLCLKHKQHFMIETSSRGFLGVYFNSECSAKVESIDEALILLDDIIKRK